ncbi:hypothetical protein ABPG75_010893 [Micractinium tetrahymenae]
MSGGCPIRHLWPAAPGAAQDAAAPPAAPQPAAAVAAAPHTPGSSSVGQDAPAAAQCPFMSKIGGMAVQNTATSGPGTAGTGAKVTPTSAAAKPGAPAGEAAGAPPAAAASPRPAVCPLGFGGGGQQPQLGEFHCLICRSLYHDCVKAACGHRFCAGCVARCRDCPVCGADIEGLEADAGTQAKVEKYIEAHTGNHTIWELEGASGQEVDGMAGERSRASFLLQLGLRAIAAGNTDSARHRFNLCQADLQQHLEAARQQGAPPAEVASLQCRLGAVSGCLGDCCRAQGDAASTLQHYQASVKLLQAAGQDPEAQQALSVALNKVGELHHMQGDLEAAAEQYAQALQLRRGLLAATQRQWAHGVSAPHAAGSSSGGGGGGRQGDSSAAVAGSAAAAAAAAAKEAAGDEACCSAALDLAASCLKLAGAKRDLGDATEAEALLGEAVELLGKMERSGALAQQPERLQRKHASLVHFAGMLGQQGGPA